MPDPDLSALSQPLAALVQHGLRHLKYYDGTTRGLPGRKTQAAYTAYIEDGESQKRDPSAFGEALATAAEGEVGKKELGVNGGPAVRKYQEATWLELGPWPWCAAFVCWCYQAATASTKADPPAFSRPTTPGAWDFENWARKEGADLIKPSRGNIARRGDIIIYTFSHVGIVVSDQLVGNPDDFAGSIGTVEGNTNPGGSREGDGVYARERPGRKVRSLIRF